MTIKLIGDPGDPMSDILGLVRMRAEWASANDFSSPWSLSFLRPLAHFHVIERGSAWLVVGSESPLRLEPGDLAILPLGTGHALTSDPALPSVPIERAISEEFVRDGDVNRYGGAGDTTNVVCGQFSFVGVLAPRLLSVLPSVIHMRPDPGRPLEWLKLTSSFLVEEARQRRAGSAIMVAQLVQLLFIQAIREWAIRGPRQLGWLNGLVDPQIGKSLSAIHAEPARGWTVEALAEIVGMSRSSFAARFTGLVGQTPVKYIAMWRLNLAADHLRAGTASISEIATAVGYGSEAAFTRAFKSQFGTTPAIFRRAK